MCVCACDREVRMGRLHDVASTCTETVCQFITLYVNYCHDVCYDIYPEWEELIRDWIGKLGWVGYNS